MRPRKVSSKLRGPLCGDTNTFTLRPKLALLPGFQLPVPMPLHVDVPSTGQPYALGAIIVQPPECIVHSLLSVLPRQFLAQVVAGHRNILLTVLLLGALINPFR